MPPRPTFSDLLKTLAHQTGKNYLRLRAAVQGRLGRTPRVKIQPYRGFGNSDELFLIGRVVEDLSLAEPSENDPWWRNARAMLRRFTACRFPGARVRARFRDETLETAADGEGFFRFHIRAPFADRPDGGSWHEVALELVDQVCPAQGEVGATASALVPRAGCRFGVISDLDDTVIESNATSFLKLAQITLLHNARTRTMLPGTARFYRALEGGEVGLAGNPFFYVSSSVWNLYDVFADFLEINGLPTGPLILRDLEADDAKLIKSGHEHKLVKIERVLAICHRLPFVLIGDAGQDDPAIYREVARRNPGRVLAIYIRAVRLPERNNRARQIACEMGDAPPMLVFETVDEALGHAAAAELIASIPPEGR